MKCENCGTENRDDAITCAICRAPLKNNIDKQEIQYVPNYVLASVIIFLFFWSIGGVVAFIYAIKANKLARESKFEEALQKAKIAKIWLIVSVIVGIVVFIALFILQSLNIKVFNNPYNFFDYK